MSDSDSHPRFDDSGTPGMTEPVTTMLVIAPDAVLRFVSGQLLIHTGTGPRLHATANPGVPRLLAAFARPADPAQVLALFSAEEQPELSAEIGKLCRVGALRPAEGRGETIVANGPSIDAQLGLIADATQRIAGAVSAMGPFANEGLVSDSGVSLPERITAITAGLTALEAEVNAMKGPFIATQLARLQIRSNARGLKLHLGCGPNRLPGWLNVDAYPAELALDLRWPLPFAAGSAELVFMSHVFEHFYYPEESSAVLAEIHRVLIEGGRLRLIVPDIEQCIKAYVERDEAFFSHRRHTWKWWSPAATRLEDFLSYAGAGPRASHFLEGHKFGYDFETLEHALRGAGFKHVVRSTYMGSEIDSLRIDDASGVAGASFNGHHYSLFVEAIK